MDEEQFDSLLRLWGRKYGEPRPQEWDEDDTSSPSGANPIHRAMEFAPRSRLEVIRRSTTMDRGGQTRRRLMALGAGVERLRVVPAAMVDPVRCVETRSGGGSGWREIPEVEQVQAAWKSLWKVDEQQAGVVRVQYQVRGMTQREKAENLGITFGNYRLLLAVGKGFIRGKLAP